MKAFFEYINRIATLDETAIKDIEDCLTIVQVPRKQILIPELSKSPYLYFIVKGVIRAYFHHNGKQITDWFGMENMVIGPTIRNFPVKETVHCVETIEDCELIRLSFADLETLYQKHHPIEKLGRIIAIQTILHLQYKIDSLQLMTAKERYQDFLTRYPDLIHRVSLGHVSSYLGMNQVTMSRIRKLA